MPLGPGRKTNRPTVSSNKIAATNMYTVAFICVSSRFAALSHQSRHRQTVRVVQGVQPIDNASAVYLGTVLARFPFAEQFGDRNFDTDDRAKLFVDERFRCVSDVPGIFARGLEPPGQSADQS